MMCCHRKGLKGHPNGPFRKTPLSPSPGLPRGRSRHRGLQEWGAPQEPTARSGGRSRYTGTQGKGERLVTVPDSRLRPNLSRRCARESGPSLPGWKQDPDRAVREEQHSPVLEPLWQNLLCGLAPKKGFPCTFCFSNVAAIYSAIKCAYRGVVLLQVCSVFRVTLRDGWAFVF